jgi:hypothetical protein
LVRHKEEKHHDKQGNEITDDRLMQDIMQGKTVISCREEKLEDKQEKHIHHLVKNKN